MILGNIISSSYFCHFLCYAQNGSVVPWLSFGFLMLAYIHTFRFKCCISVVILLVLYPHATNRLIQVGNRFVKISYCLLHVWKGNSGQCLDLILWFMKTVFDCWGLLLALTELKTYFFSERIWDSDSDFENGTASCKKGSQYGQYRQKEQVLEYIWVCEYHFKTDSKKCELIFDWWSL